MTTPAPTQPPDGPPATDSVNITLDSGFKGRVLKTWGRLRAYREAHATAEMAVFFLAGFLFDVVTLSRIDDLTSLVQQGVYLAVLAGLLTLEQRDVLKGDLPPWLMKVLRFGEDAIHFFFGSLLSSFALFYFKSASGLTALLFVAIMFGLLVANELPRFRKLGPIIRLAIFSFALTSYFAYLLPVIFGYLHAALFVSASAIALALGAAGAWMLRRWGLPLSLALKRAVLPAAAVQAVLLSLYFAKAIPPVPLSLQYFGIYHGVEVAGGDWLLLHQRPWWKVWQNGDQRYVQRPGDVLYAFSQIFAPSRFNDRLYVRWSTKVNGNWHQSDAIPVQITGTRALGRRGITFKKNFGPGEWRAEIETDDGRTVGSIRLWVEEEPKPPEGQPYPPRVFQVDRK